MWRGLRRTQEEQIDGQLSLWLRQRPHGGGTLGKSVLPAGRCWSLQGDWAPPGLPVGEESACRRGDPGSFLGSGRCPGEGNDTPLQILAWKNPMEGEAWRATVPGVASVSGAGRHRRGRAEESTANAEKTLLSSPEPRCRPLLTTFSVVKVAQSCPTHCDPVDYPVGGILQARILEQVAFPLPRGSSQPRDWTQVSRIAGGFFTSWVTREGP